MLQTLLLGRFIKAYFTTERFCKNQMIGYHNRIVCIKNKDQGAKINLAMAILIIIFSAAFLRDYLLRGVGWGGGGEN